MQPDSRLWNRAFFVFAPCLLFRRDQSRPIATNRDQSRPIATFSAPCLLFRRDQSRPIATSSAPCLLFRRDQSRPIATNRDQSRPIATNRDFFRRLVFCFGATNRDQSRPIATDCDRIGRPPPSTLFRPANGIRSSFSQFFCHPLRFFTKILFFCHPLRFFTKMWGGG